MQLDGYISPTSGGRTAVTLNKLPPFPLLVVSYKIHLMPDLSNRIGINLLLLSIVKSDWRPGWSWIQCTSRRGPLDAHIPDPARCALKNILRSTLIRGNDSNLLLETTLESAWTFPLIGLKDYNRRMDKQVKPGDGKKSIKYCKSRNWTGLWRRREIIRNKLESKRSHADRS